MRGARAGRGAAVTYETTADASRLRPIRWRTTWIAVVVVGAALVVAATAMILTLRHTLTEHVREDATLRAQEVARVLSNGLGRT